MTYISKRFLSDDHDETGSMVVRVNATKKEDMGPWSAKECRVEAEVTFRDCHGKPIYLQFGLDNDHTLEARFKKIDLIVEELQVMKLHLRQALHETQDAAAEWLTEHPEEK